MLPRLQTNIQIDCLKKKFSSSNKVYIVDITEKFTEERNAMAPKYFITDIKHCYKMNNFQSFFSDNSFWFKGPKYYMYASVSYKMYIN